MKRLLLFFTILSFIFFASYYSNPASALPEQVHSGSIKTEIEADANSATITLDNYIGTEFKIDYSYVVISYSGENIITLTTATGLTAPSATGVSFAPRDANSKLTIIQPSFSPDSLAIDCPNAILSTDSSNILKISADNSRVAIRAKSFMTSVSGIHFTDSGYETYSVDFEKIIEISSLASSRSPFSFGIPGTDVDADHFSYDQPSITYSYTISDDVGTFSLLHEIRGVNVHLLLDNLPEFPDLTTAENYLKSTLSRDDNNPAVLNDVVFVQTTNSNYDIDIDASHLIRKPDGSTIFRLVFNSNDQKFGFTNLVDFCPIACLVFNGQEIDGDTINRQRSDDGYSQSFDIPVNLSISELSKIELLSIPEEPVITPEESEQTDRIEKSSIEPEKTTTTTAKNVTSPQVFIPRAPNTSIPKSRML